jgi:hypothetical protein
MRLDGSAPGIAMVGTFRAGSRVVATTTIDFYGADAEERASVSAQRWRDWLEARFATVSASDER